MLCVFKLNEGGTEETYTGTFQSISAERAPRVGLVMIWDVKATLAVTGVPGLLQQLYVMDAAAAPGRTSPLIGDTNHSVVLETIADDHHFHSEEKKKPNTGTISLLIVLRLRTTPI
jgi:hypothetical protein